MDSTGVIPGPGGNHHVSPGAVGYTRGGELADRAHDLQLIAGGQLGGGPRAEDAVGDPLDANAELPAPRWCADGVRAPHILAADLGPQHHVLTGEVIEFGAQLRRDVEGEAHRVGGLGLDLGDTQGVEGNAHASSLKWSKGSRQRSHRYKDLHAVDPNCEIWLVARDPHCGHRTPA